MKRRDEHLQTLFEKSVPGRVGYSIPLPEVPEAALPDDIARDKPAELPELSEVAVNRHFTRISQKNHGIDTGMYPLGSCTMKYNPRINEQTARIPGFARLHPNAPISGVQGALHLMHELGEYLAEISGLPAVTLQPAAGAQGEMTGLMIIRAFHTANGNPRKKVLVPDTAHGTNPASCTICNYSVVTVATNERGRLDLDDLRSKCDEETAALMVTNPSTLGLFEDRIDEAAKIVHDAGGLVYCDGANLNAILGVTRPGDFGADVMHINLHKTFTTPHGGGGPGSGPVAMRDFLAPFMPKPVVVEDSAGRYTLDFDRPQSIGRVHEFFGNFGMLVRAYTYIREMGPENLKRVSTLAVMNANYVKESLKGLYHLPFDEPCMHECVLSDKDMPNGVTTMDIAKRLMDFGIHPPTVYFPLVVKGALMIEPTETESPENVRRFVEVMRQIHEEAKTNPQLVKGAPHTTPVGRVDEALAARQLHLTADLLPPDADEERQLSFDDQPKA
ncbi:aminomethyl-transferring glycine dehydrogenase subunit GcvPB [bacterium]|nr:aminomethyl-transferring glycine dehydrogenase subunit GcvPB [bacterium]